MKKIWNWYLGIDTANDEKILARRRKAIHSAKSAMSQAVDMIATGAVVFCTVARSMR